MTHNSPVDLDDPAVFNAEPPKKSHVDDRPPEVRFAKFAEQPFETRIESLQHTATHSTRAIKECARHAERLRQCFDGIDHAPRAVERFLNEDTDWDERISRWAALHTFELVFGYKLLITPWPGWRPDNPHLRSRPLSEIELGALRLTAAREVRVAATVGFLDAGAGSGDLQHILNRHVEFEGSVPVGVCLEAASMPRTLEIPEWCRDSVAHFHYDDLPNASLLYRGKATDPSKIQSCLLMRVNWAMRRIGLWVPDPDKVDKKPKLTKPISIRDGAAREAYNSRGDIEQVSHRMGITHLTECQRHIGLLPQLPLYGKKDEAA